MKILAEKMDTLESWGVLQKPENIGVIPEFVVPSMLTPKPDSDEYRLVTDFTSLNKGEAKTKSGYKQLLCLKPIL